MAVIGGARKARIPLPHAIGKYGATCGSVVRHDLSRCRALTSCGAERIRQRKQRRPAGFNRPTNLRFGPDGCAYVVDYGAVRDAGADTHVVGAANGPLVQIPSTGVVFKICAQ